MAGRFCSKCGAAREFSARKFCTNCGAPYPDPAPEAAPGGNAKSPAYGSGIPGWMFVVAGILVICAAVVLLLPHLAQVTGTPSAGPTGTGDSLPLRQSPSGTPLPGVSTVSTTSTAVTPGSTRAAIPVRTTTPVTSPATIPTTQVPITTRTPTPTPATIVPTAVPAPAPVSVITLAVTQVPPQPPPGSYTSSTSGALYIDPSVLEGRVHELINIQRQQNGLSTLSYDPFLADISRGHSWDMVTRNFFEHENPDGKNARARGDAAGYPCKRDMGAYTYEGISENLFEGYRYKSYMTTDGVITSYNWSSADEIAERAVTGWMNSPGHRQNILTEHFLLEGIGVAFSADDRIFITENFC